MTKRTLSVAFTYINAYLILFQVESHNTIPHHPNTINYHLVQYALNVMRIYFRYKNFIDLIER
ncbi:hypothetical protein ALTERO38_51736 [Alteromonas sp. 38]|nr:hypothetical protein ALTER154_80285 [Alteromonas sp. 154]VXB85189.1 hypothetical protein ALTERO38_51736 [Alteromonas sp. 38]